MDLFVFGLGYSALHFVRTRRRGLVSVAGTVRSEAKAAALAHEGIDALVFAGENRHPAILARLAMADALLVSIPPGAHDPVLAEFAEGVATAPRLRTIAYLSTVGVYGDHGGGWVDEATPPRPASPRSRERTTAEAEWARLGAAAGKPVHILRLGGIYGPDRNVLVKLREGTAQRLVKPGQVFNRIHVEDISRAIEAVLGRGAAGDVWNVVDDEPAPPQDVVAFAASLIGMAPPPEIAFDTADLPAMTRSFYGENKRVSNAKLKRDLDLKLAYPTYREGLAALARQGDGRSCANSE